MIKIKDFYQERVSGPKGLHQIGIGVVTDADAAQKQLPADLAHVVAAEGGVHLGLDGVVIGVDAELGEKELVVDGVD